MTPTLAGRVTVGRFYAELAQAKHLVSVDATSAEANLRGAGFDLPKLDLSKTLTEGDVSVISNALGVAVTTQRPSQQISEFQLSTFISVFRGELGASVVQASDPFETNVEGDPGRSGNGKGKKKGHHKSTSEP